MAREEETKWRLKTCQDAPERQAALPSLPVAKLDVDVPLRAPRARARAQKGRYISEGGRRLAATKTFGV